MKKLLFAILGKIYDWDKPIDSKWLEKNGHRVGNKSIGYTTTIKNFKFHENIGPGCHIRDSNNKEFISFGTRKDLILFLMSQDDKLIF